MPKCKYCGQSITKFDKEMCPYCGGKYPIDSANPQTADITEAINTVNPTDEARVNFKPKKKVINAILCMSLGVFGIDELYLGFRNRFIIRLIINAVCYIGLLLIFYFSKTIVSGTLLFLLPFIIVFGVWFIIGAIFFALKNKKDSNGAFLK